MRINNQTPVNSTEPTLSTSRTDSPLPGSASPNQAANNSTPSSAAGAAGDYGLVPSFELLSLNAALSEIPPLRPDVLAATVRRLSAGDLHTPSAVQQTADAILG